MNGIPVRARTLMEKPLIREYYIGDQLTWIQIDDQITHPWADDVIVAKWTVKQFLNQICRRQVWREGHVGIPHHIERAKPDGDA